jgi:hypothetical protein
MNIIIGFTDVSQKDIIKKTYEYFQKYDSIPKPTDIFPEVDIIKVNPYIFREFIKTNKLNSILSNTIKIFFTNCIDLNKIKKKRFPLKYNIQKLDINYIQNQIDLQNLNLDVDIDVFNLYNKFKEEYYIKYE